MNKPSAAAMRAAKLLCYTNHTSLVRSTAARIIDAEFAPVVEAAKGLASDLGTPFAVNMGRLKAALSKLDTPEEGK